MRKNFTTILIVVLISTINNFCHAQWTTVYQDASAQFYDAAFPTETTGYVAANDISGTVVLRTNDGGVTWNRKLITGWNFIDKITMIDSVRGYLIKGGVPVQILKTTDGFNSYIKYNLDTSFIVQALEVLNDSTGFYLNNGTRLRKFSNNGASFNHVIDTLFDGQNLQFVNDQVGYLDNGIKLLKTTDGGSSWNFINNHLGFFCVLFKFADSLNGYFYDGFYIHKTSNGGVNFSNLYNFSNATDLTANGNLCMATNDEGNVAFTRDTGLTWQTETSGINFIGSDNYKVKSTPGGSYFLFSQFCGEIRKREPIGTNVNSLIRENIVSIFPNPFTSNLSIRFDEYQSGLVILISDVLGKEISALKFTGKELTLDDAAWPSGLYFVTFIDENGKSFSRRIVKS